MNTENPLNKTFIINGENFCDLQGFYNEVERVLASGPTWRSTNNLNAFEKLLSGEGGVLNPQEPVILLWKNISKSKTDFSRISHGSDIYLTIMEIIRSQDHIQFIEH